ncbi:MAG TPA: hypothetical protein VLB44_01080 [Kofleriaceae bacterium]|nr:hypothetical protein [Kofleriaceae bacterium]
MSRAWVPGVVVCLLGLSTRVHAETSSAQTKARLYYQKAGGSGCPDVEDVRRAIGDRMGYDPFVDAAPLIVLVAISFDPDTTRRARISVIDGTGKEWGQREIVSNTSSCEDLASTVALIVSVAIPAATEHELEARREAELEALKRRSFAPLPDPTVEASHATGGTSDGTIWRMLVGGRASMGAVPGVAPGLTLGFGVRRDAFSGEAELLGDFARTQHVEQGVVDTSLYRGALVLCRHGGDFALCALAAVGAMHAEGHGFTKDIAITNPYLGVGGRVCYERAIARGFSAVVHLDAETAIETTTLSVDTDTSWKWVAPGASIAGGIALGSRFP